MVALMVRCRVADYDAWKADWTAAVRQHFERGEVRSFRVWRGIEDANLIFVAEDFESREIAEAVLNDPAARQAMAAHGVELSSLQSDLADEVDSGTR